MYNETTRYHVLHERVNVSFILTKLHNIVVKNVKNLESPPM